MKHATTQWAPPTAEQFGLIGTNWSKGWIIENNTISDSRCLGITFGNTAMSWPVTIDFFGNKRNNKHPVAMPFEKPEGAKIKVRIR